MIDVAKMVSAELEKKILAEMTGCFGCNGTYSDNHQEPFSADDMLAAIKKIDTIPKPQPIRVFTNNHMVETIQTRFPKSKKKRIRRKFAKKYRKSVPMLAAYFDQANGRLFCHPSVAGRIASDIGVDGGIKRTGDLFR